MTFCPNTALNKILKLGKNGYFLPFLDGVFSLAIEVEKQSTSHFFEEGIDTEIKWK